VIIGSFFFFSFFIVILSPSTSLFKGQKEKYCSRLKWCLKGLPARWGNCYPSPSGRVEK
jgi:hypothetical protein